MLELAIIANDIQQIISTAIAFNILFGLQLWIGALITSIDTLTFQYIQYFGIKKQEFVFAMLVAIMAVCFIADVFTKIAPVDKVILGLQIPKLKSRDALKDVLGLVGATITPHNLYLHSGSIATRDLERSNQRYVKESIKYFSIDTWISLFISFIINLSIMIVFALNFNDPKYKDMGLQEASKALEGLLGSSASIIWGIGQIAAGQAATMAGTFAGQYIMEGFLRLNIQKWKRVLITRCIALIPSLILVLVQKDPSKFDSSNLANFLNIIQTIQQPFALIPLIYIVFNKNIMGINTFNRAYHIFSWIQVAILLVSIVQALSDSPQGVEGPKHVFEMIYTGYYLIFSIPFTIIYTIIIGFLVYIGLAEVFNAIKERVENPNLIDLDTTNLGPNENENEYNV